MFTVTYENMVYVFLNCVTKHVLLNLSFIDSKLVLCYVPVPTNQITVCAHVLQILEEKSILLLFEAFGSAFRIIYRIVSTAKLYTK